MPTNTLATAARLFYTSQTHYLSQTFTFSQFPTTGNFDFQIGTIPGIPQSLGGSRILRASYITGTVIGTGTATIALGNVAGGAQFVAAATFGTLGLVNLTIVAASAAPYCLVDTPVWARIVVSGAGLTGLVSDVIVEYAVSHGPTGQG